ncbi:MAG: iduronate-2-sulfatase [Pedobacter sp.]|nr:MAG: iduronate-2-sulfatase [Pedobacter sp.]
MLRRKFLKWSLGSLAIGAAGIGCKESTMKPNVLFIAIDDLNTWVGCLKHLRQHVPTALTPNIDKLASQGALFSNAHAPVPWCMPSRNNTLTGLYANQSGIFNSEEFRNFLPDIKTLPQHFMDNGYYTLAGGKLFHDTYPDAQSWNEYEQFPRPASQKRQNPPLNHMESNDDMDTMDWGKIEAPDKDLTDAKIADWAIQQLDKTFDKPFFMGVGFRFPHLPWYLPHKYLEKYPLDSISLPWVKDDDLDDVPLAGKKMAFNDPFATEWSPEKSDHTRIVKSNNWKPAVQAYLAAISCMDEQLGHLLEKLESSKYSKNTIVVLWSDNGFHLGEKLHWRKFTLWDEATRVPLVIRAPGAKAKGIINNQAVSLVDIYPTLIELCGLSMPAHKLGGESLVKLMYDAKAQRNTPVFTTYGKGNDSVVDGRWRYIRYADNSEELYDHQADPQEWVNVSDKKELMDIKNKFKAFLS